MYLGAEINRAADKYTPKDNRDVADDAAGRQSAK
jgi:hypothetical protein